MERIAKMVNCPCCKKKSISMFEKSKTRPSDKNKCSECGCCWSIVPFFHYSIYFFISFTIGALTNYAGMNVMGAAITGVFVGFVALLLQQLGR